MSEPEHPDRGPTYHQEVQHHPATARVPEKVGLGVFSTGTIVMHGPHDFVIDFLQSLAMPRRVAARVILPPTVVPLFLAAMQDNFAKYTAAFGPLPRMPQPPGRTPPQEGTARHDAPHAPHDAPRGDGPGATPLSDNPGPGGSGGGSSAALAAFEAPLAIGTDTGGSIRQPAAVTGTVGVKPTYGGVSRYGLVAFSSSLDQAGPCARTVLDAAYLHEVIGGYDPLDSTSINAPLPALVNAAKSASVKGMKIGVIKELQGDGYQAGVLKRFNEALDELAKLGAEIVEVSCPHFEYALAAYYLIAPSECSSNLARFDAMRYGIRVGEGSAEEVMNATREVGFGKEVKRRIILGTYALSSGYYDAYYGSAQKVRTLISRDFEQAFTKADVLVSPTAPTTAFKIGEKANDPIAMYLNDIATIPTNLAGVCGISVPSGLADEDGLPAGFQIMAGAMKDDRLYQVGAALEAALLSKWGAPILSKAPKLGAK